VTKLALSEGTSVTLYDKTGIVRGNLRRPICQNWHCLRWTLLHYDTQQYAMKLAHLNLIINWANVLINTGQCFDSRTCIRNKIEYVIALAEIKPKFLLWICKTSVTIKHTTCLFIRHVSSLSRVTTLIRRFWITY